MKDSKNLLLVLLSAGLMSTWAYHLYDKSGYSNHQVAILVKDSLATQEAIRDSLQKLYNQKAFELDTTKIRTEEIQGRLDSTQKKIFGLKNQIADILKKRTFNQADLRKANDLVRQYRESIVEMKEENTNLESEKERLSGILSQLNDEVKGLQQNIQKISDENKILAETINEASMFIVSDMNLSAVATKSGSKKEAETNLAKKANKFVFTFNLQNNIARTAFYDLYVVITEPGNKVLQNDVWGGSYFNSKTEGSKPYTTKIHFEYNKAEKKQIIYTLEPDSFLPGTYLMQVYQNGVVIGAVSKSLK